MAAAVVGAGEARGIPRVGFLDLVIYGVGSAAFGIRDVIVPVFTVFFYTSVMGLSGALVGLAVAIGLVADGVVDPFIGHASDHSRSHLGRRHPYMLVGGATLGLSFWMLFTPPQGLSVVWLFAWLMTARLLMSVTYSVFMVPYYALGAELTNDYHERTRLTAVRTFCMTLAQLLAAGLAFVLFFPNVIPGVDPKLSYGGYPTMGLVFGLVMSAIAILSTLATARWRPYLHSVSASDDTRDGARAGRRPGWVVVFRDWLSTLENPGYRALFLATLISGFGMGILTGSQLYFLTYFVRITDSAEVSLVSVALLGSVLLGVPICLWVMRLGEKRSILLIAKGTVGLLIVALYLLVGSGRPFGTGDFRFLLAGFAWAGVLFAFTWILAYSMLADVADDDALRRGERREGILFGMGSFAQAAAAALSMVALGLLVDFFAGVVPGQAEQSALTVERIGVVFAVIPGALEFLSASMLLRYPLDRRTVAAIQARLAERGLGRPESAAPAARSLQQG